MGSGGIGKHLRLLELIMESVLITGSAKGLGRELAFAFARHGHKVILHDRDKSLKEVAAKILNSGGVCKSVYGDLRSERTIRLLARVIQRENVSVLINNAGLHCPGLSANELSFQHTKDIVGTNLTAPILLSLQAYRTFLARGSGTFIFINSLSGLESHKPRTLYCASKWGLRGFADSLRMEAKEHGMRVFSVYPSRIKTRPEFTFGMEPSYVASEVYKAYADPTKDDLILDDRPQSTQRNTARGQ